MPKLTPEKLLEKVKSQKETLEGKLKIFLGYSSGVGKTFHMLDLARDLKQAGKDIVVGYIERHDRKETLALLDGMEIIEPKKILYKGLTLQEVDVENVIKRNPSIVIIDECAHTNVHGSLNEKRYQDIMQILKHGIDVYTTLNIQHIESLNEIVRKITNIRIKEVVPDKFVKMADNIELIDIEPEELLIRIESRKSIFCRKCQKGSREFFYD